MAVGSFLLTREKMSELHSALDGLPNLALFALACELALQDTHHTRNLLTVETTSGAT